MSESTRDSSQRNTRDGSPRVGIVREPSDAPCRSGVRWKIRLLRNDLTGTDEIEIRGFRTDGTKLKIRLPAANRSDFKALTRELNARSARIPSALTKQREFVNLLVRSIPSQAVMATSMPGFRDGAQGFVMPRTMYGSAKGKYVWVDETPTSCGQLKGTLQGYKQKVLEPIAHSPLLSLGIMCALAAPLYNYVLQRTGCKILSESMVCFFHGQQSQISVCKT